MDATSTVAEAPTTRPREKDSWSSTTGAAELSPTQSCAVGEGEGDADGDTVVGLEVGDVVVGELLGLADGDTVGELVGAVVGAVGAEDL